MNDDIIKMFIDGEEVVCNNKFSIKEEMLSASSAILNNCYPKSWEEDRDYISRFYFPNDYTKFIIGSGNYKYGTEQYYVLTATGENPSFETNITKELNSINTYGKSTQETTTGKNLFNIDKILSVTGMAASNPLVLQPGTYKLSCSNLQTSGASSSLFLIYYEDNTTLNVLISSSIKEKTFTTTKVTKNVNIYSQNSYATSQGVTTTFTELMISTTDGEYEPYTGGQPSPNPDYPQEIESVGYENLLNPNRPIASSTSAGITVTNNGDGTYTATGTSTRNGAIDLTEINIIKLKKGLPYTNSIEILSGQMQGQIAVTVTNEDETTTYNYINVSSSVLSKTVTPNDNKTIKNYQLYWNTSGITMNFTFRVQLEESPVVHPYIPYGKYGIEYKTVGKNLINVDDWFNSRNVVYTKNGNTYSITDKGQVFSSRHLLNLKHNTTYTLSVSPIAQSTINPRVQIHDEENNTDYTIYFNATQTPHTITFTTNSTSTYSIRLNWSSVVIPMIIENLQLEQNSTATEYEPYQEQTQLVTLDEPLRSIGNVKDKLRIENNTVYVDRYIGRVVFNGSENWGINASQQRANTSYFYRTQSDMKAVSNLYSNYFINRAVWNTDQEAIQSILDNLIRLRINTNRASTIEELKSWLSTHPTEVIYELAEPYVELVGNGDVLHSYIGQNNFIIESGLETIHDINYYWKNYDVIFSGIVKNTGKISLNPREPHYCNLQVLDYKTFLSESDSLDFVISNKTIQEAIEMVVDYIKDYGFILGNIELNSANEVIGVYSTLNQSPYDVLQYLAKISGSVWRTRIVDEKLTAIDFYDIEYLPYNLSILYNTQFFEDNNIVDINFSYGTRDYRNKQIILSNEVYADIPYIENIFGDGYSDTFELQENVGYVNSIIINGVEQKVITQEEKEIGLDYDFYYTPNKNIIVSNIIQPSNTEIIVNYTPIIKGRQVIYNENEVNRVAMNTETKGVIARYETRNDTLSSNELNQIGQTYIKYKGNAEIILTLKTKDKDLYNIGERIFFDAPINELKQEYMVKSKTIEYIVLSGIPTFFYTYELTSSFNSESAINYFDNQRNKASGNISLGESITRNIDISNNATIFFKDLTITEITATGDNILNSVLDSPFNN